MTHRKIEEYHNSKIISLKKINLYELFFNLSDENKDFQKKI